MPKEHAAYLVKLYNIYSFTTNKDLTPSTVVEKPLEYLTAAGAAAKLREQSSSTTRKILLY